MNNNHMVEMFCTPIRSKETDFDIKAYAGAENMDIKFENRILKGYSLGKGRNILLVHGWGSRASHLVLLARSLANKGFRVFVYDGPAHGYSEKKEENDTSNMFEFGRAISCAAKSIGDIYAVAGHSLGAIAAAFTVAGTGLLSGFQFPLKKLILISSPESMTSIIENFTRKRNAADKIEELSQSLENAFNFKISEYNLSSALKDLDTETLIIHDEEDDEIPVSDALKLKKANERFKLILTKGCGHQKILINKNMLRSVNEFLSS